MLAGQLLITMNNSRTACEKNTLSPALCVSLCAIVCGYLSIPWKLAVNSHACPEGANIVGIQWVPKSTTSILEASS